MNLASIIDGHPDDSIALISRGKPTTYGVLRQQVGAMRGALVELGVQPGDRVVVMCGNSRYFVVAYLATLGIGAVAVPLNLTSPSPEIERELVVIQPRVAFIDPAAVSAWNGVNGSVRATVAHVISTEGEAVDRGLQFEELLNRPAVAVRMMGDSDHAVYVFTSGTAGAPKAAILTHGCLRANIEQVNSVEGIVADDVFFCVLPLFHIFGLNVVLGCALSLGATVVLVQRFDPVSALDTIVDRGVTIVPGAPTMWAAFAQMIDFPKEKFAKVRLCLSGAAKLPESIATAMDERYGIRIYEGYGLTEASPVVTTSLTGDWTPGTIGRPLPGVRVVIVDEEGEQTRQGDPGELWVKGPNVFAGYLDEPEATERTLRNGGWLRTGDIGVIDEDGNLYLVDRAKDLIIVSGFNVYPAEVEEALLRHPDIIDAGVVGVSHPHTGETVHAYVVTRDNKFLDEDSIIDFCRGQLARYKCPSKVLVVDELPRNVSGKILRRELH